MASHNHSHSYTSSFNAIYSHSYSNSYSGRMRRPQRPPALGSLRRDFPNTDQSGSELHDDFHTDPQSNFPNSFSEPDFRSIQLREEAESFGGGKSVAITTAQIREGVSFSSDLNLERDLQPSFSRENSYGNISNSTSSSSLSYHLGANPEQSTSILFIGDGAESDDEMHEPEPGSFSYDPKSAQKKAEKENERGTVFTKRGALNLMTIALLLLALLALFIGYPVFNYVENLKKKPFKIGSVNLGGMNASGQIPKVEFLRSLIDPDTPLSARSKLGLDGKPMKLVFSDEFNVDGRTFYPGDDPFWEAADLHYWVTLNYEWYSPSAVTTQDGALKITLSEQANHGLNFKGGMVTTWNSFCFTGGHVEVSARLPGSPTTSGLWPAIWTMGNLGRAGYGATTDGTWPYSYNECDVGTLHNQTYPGGGPSAARTSGAFPEKYGGSLSYLPGQRLSRCTCRDDSDHPGPKNADGSWTGRSAPEIDVFESDFGHVSMSMQVAPFDEGFNIDTSHVTFYDNSTVLNSYKGSVYQQAASGLVLTDHGAYELSDNYYDTYGFEYVPGASEESHITWTRSSKPTWRLDAKALGPNQGTEIAQRHIPDEPMYLIINLGISSGFSFTDWENLKFPAHFLIDWIRVFQPEDQINIGCSPSNMPTADYIEKHWEAYQNPDLTTWSEPRNRSGYAAKVPGNRLKGECSALPEP